MQLILVKPDVAGYFLWTISSKGMV